ncbi:MAG: hypothetical protein JNK11_20175 [Alphaproteobacteria bacterium]|nr:hypothetical protein [Alphaproteobacteria bacterium]
MQQVRPQPQSDAALAATLPSAGHGQVMLAAQLDLLYRNVGVIVVATMVNAAALAFVQRTVVDQATLLAWLGALAAAMVLRVVVVRAYRRGVKGPEAARRWANIYVAAAFATGAVWGAGGVLLLPQESVAHQALTCLVLTGMSAAAIATLATLYRAYVAYILPLLLPLGFQLAANGGELQLTMLAMLVMLVVYLLAAGRQHEASVKASLALRFDNAALVRELSEKMQRVEQLYGDMQREMAERARIEDALRAATRSAEAASRAKTDFLAMMSHELRTPLNAVLGFSQILAAEPAIRGQQRLADRVTWINSSGNHLLRLINEILDLTAIESGKLALRLQRLSLRGPLLECLPLVEPQARARGIVIADETAASPPPDVLADPSRLGQILLNLLTNAVKYNRDGGTVSISAAAQPDGAVRIAVRDTGRGVPEDRRDELFLPFSRLGAERSSIPGTGIGLALSRQIAMQMGGKMGHEPIPGGSVFWVEMPMAADGK